MATVWKGTDEEAGELQAAIANHCACTVDGAGVRTATCAPHDALLSDQKFLDGVLFYRRQRDKLLAEEALT